MKRKELKEIINAVINKMQENTPAAACGFFYDDACDITTYYAVGEEDSAPTLKPTETSTPEPTPVPPKETLPPITTYYAVGEEG